MIKMKAKYLLAICLFMSFFASAAQKWEYKGKSGIARLSSTIILSDIRDNSDLQLLEASLKVTAFGSTVLSSQSKSYVDAHSLAFVRLGKCTASKTGTSCKTTQLEDNEFLLHKQYGGGKIDLAELIYGESGVYKNFLDEVFTSFDPQSDVLRDHTALIIDLPKVKFSPVKLSKTYFVLDGDRLAEVKALVNYSEINKSKYTVTTELVSEASDALKENLPRKFVVDAKKKVVSEIHIHRNDGKIFVLKIQN